MDLVDVFVTVSVEGNEPTVHVVTENGELVTLRLDKIAGDLIISRSLSLMSSVSSANDSR